MASGIEYGSTTNENIECKIEWSATVTNAEENLSYFTLKLYYRRNNTGFTTSGTGTFSLYIDGSKVSTQTKYMTIQNSWVLAASYTTDIAHDEDGSKSVSFYATGSIPDTTLTGTDIDGSAEFDTIPRASTVAASNVTLGNKCKVTWTPASYNFRFKIKFSIGDWSYTTGYISPDTTSSYTYTGYTIPVAAAEEITGGKTGTMTATLYTYSGTALVGSKSDTFTVTVPNNDSTQPDVTMTLAPVSSLASPLNTLYIQGYSRVKATLSATAKEGATISSLSMTVQGKTYGSPYQSDLLTKSGSVEVVGTAKDSRGISGTITKTITVVAYSKPQILPTTDESAIICARCDENGKLTDSGTCLKIKARRSYSKLTAGGAQKNFCEIRYRYRKESSASFTAWETLLAAATTSTDKVDVTIKNHTFDSATAYVVQIGVVDSIGNADAEQFGVSTNGVTLHLAKGGKRIGLLRYAEDSEEEGIDVGAPIHGGSVDNLTLGTLLTATATAPIDLNDIKIVGNYYSPSAASSQYITNSPIVDSGFGLIVREIQSTAVIRQELYYSRTNWQRHWDGTQWSDWLRYMMTGHAETITADYVIETGVKTITEGSWRFRKWRSGAVDMNGAFTIKPEMEGTTGTAVVRYSKQIQIPLPFKVENFQFTGSPATNYFLFANANVTTDAEGNNNVSFRLLRFSDFSDISVTVRIIASGRYKT